MTYTFQASPNFSQGRRGLVVKYLVIHAMAGTYLGTIQWFLNKRSGVSAHYCISQKGEVVQMVKESDRAWHVGKANALSIGIELEDAGRCLKDTSWITPELYQAALKLAADICTRNKIPVTNVIGHNDPVMRKYGNDHADPGLFDMAKFRIDLRSIISERK